MSAAAAIEPRAEAPRTPMLEVDRLCIDYHRRGQRLGRKFRAVDEVSLTVHERQIVGVVGESGSGKTSLGLSIAGLVPHTSGSVRVRGRSADEVARWDRLAARADVQVVFQSPFESLDPRQRLDRGLDELRSIHPERTAWTDNADLFGMVGLDESLLRRFPHEISGGQAQRVSIARAVLLKPAVLVADEPTSALDVSVQARLLRLLAELRDTQGLAILFISHDLGVVRQLCDEVHVMASSRVVESGHVVEVFDRPQHEYTQRLLSYVPGRSGNVLATGEAALS